MATATDDRGKPCAMAELSAKQIGVRALGIRSLVDDDTERELRVTDKLELTIAIAAGVLAAVLWQLAFFLVPGSSPLRLLGLCAGYVVVPPLAALLAWRLSLGAVRRRRFRRLAEIYLSTGRCASCGYGLTGLAPQGDGCVVCPECGAAWRSERVATADAAAAPHAETN